QTKTKRKESKGKDSKKNSVQDEIDRLDPKYEYETNEDDPYSEGVFPGLCVTNKYKILKERNTGIIFEDVPEIKCKETEVVRLIGNDFFDSVYGMEHLKYKIPLNNIYVLNNSKKLLVELENKIILYSDKSPFQKIGQLKCKCVNGRLPDKMLFFEDSNQHLWKRVKGIITIYDMNNINEEETNWKLYPEGYSIYENTQQIIELPLEINKNQRKYALALEYEIKIFNEDFAPDAEYPKIEDCGKDLSSFTLIDDKFLGMIAGSKTYNIRKFDLYEKKFTLDKYSLSKYEGYSDDDVSLFKLENFLYATFVDGIARSLRILKLRVEDLKMMADIFIPYSDDIYPQYSLFLFGKNLIYAPFSNIKDCLVFSPSLKFFRTQNILPENSWKHSFNEDGTGFVVKNDDANNYSGVFVRLEEDK
ncbi:MAG: hypothetical protein MJ252_22405, partial [archaeon]|nr:hypothetical protein [archaeon]